MNIRLAYNFDLDLFQKLFPGTQLFDWDRDGNEKIDLLIFPGGEDVSLEYYLDREMIERFAPLCNSNAERDEKEIRILSMAVGGAINVNKILGICRGIQLFGVMFGGSLFPDLNTYGNPHPYMHNIHHKTPSNLDFFKTVNSMHHQGIRNMGNEFFRLGISKKSYPKFIALDGMDAVVEIGTWLNDRILGLQFHPEYYDETHQDKNKFREFVNSWVSGNTTILK